MQQMIDRQLVELGEQSQDFASVEGGAAWESPPSSPSAYASRSPGGCESAERAGSFSGCWSVCCSWSVKPCTSSLLDLGSAREERSGRSCRVLELGERLASSLPILSSWFLGAGFEPPRGRSERSSCADACLI
jgi:hypothetical protein